MLRVHGGRVQAAGELGLRQKFYTAFNHRLLWPNDSCVFADQLRYNTPKVASN